MFSVAVIIFREVFEIALVVGILLVATKGMVGRRRWVSSGIALGALGSVALAFFTKTLSEGFGGTAQEVFNAVVLFAASLLIGWTVVWMRVYGRCMSQQMQQVGKAIACNEKPLHTLAIVAGLSTLREGSEAVLFTFGVLASGQKPTEVITGGVAGLLIGAAVGAVLYLGLIKIPPRRLFSVTSFLLVFLAAGMVSQGLQLLSSVGYVPELIPALWDSSSFLPESGIVGRTLHVLLGYAEKPSGIQAVGYLLTFMSIFFVSRRLQSRADKNINLKNK